MDEQPRNPRQPAVEFEPANLRHRGRTANRRHRSLVPIFESRTFRASRAKGEFIANDPRDVLGHLHRRGRDTGHRFAFSVRNQRHVANREHFGMSGHAQVRFDLHASAAVQLHAELLRERIGQNARSPDDVFCFDDLAVLQFHAALSDIPGFGARAHFHAELFKLSLSAGGELRRQM